MDRRSPTYEASLLYEAPGASDPAMLASEISRIARQHGLDPRSTATVGGIFLHIDCGGIHLLLALCPEPLPIEHFLEASRPPACTTDEQVILRRLTRQTSHLTVLVMDTPDAGPGTTLPPRDVKHGLCMDIVDHLARQTAPGFVFWAENDTLYTADEFSRQCDFLVAQALLTGSLPILRHAHLHEDPVLAPEAAEWLAEDPVAGSDAPEDGSSLDQAIADLARQNLKLGLVPVKCGRNAGRALRSIAMACCGATVGLSSGLGGFF